MGGAYYYYAAILLPTILFARIDNIYIILMIVTTSLDGVNRFYR